MGYNVVLVFGIILFAISMFLFRESLDFIKKGSRAVATVVDYKVQKDSDGDTYKPVFKFKTDAGEEIVYTHPFATSPKSWDLGEEVAISYDPSNPYHAKVLSYFSVFNWSIVCMVIAMVLLTISGGYYLTLPLLK
jgi:hypothetical protein